ncbi:hypothetical protein [Microbacterium sp. SS28]|uniref:hypothetical protein n=1 Tax=Microbacterium sp. SS28 TaxID=2919948 RepID=UPI001FA995D3|nr:hypothetical protein [Microbacterium sp. SS28]
MVDAQIGGPSWIAPESRRYFGENPLAVSRHVTAQSRKLATAAISTTTHARYYALHSLVADECERRGYGLDEQMQLMRRCEVVLAAVTIAHRDEHPRSLNPHGVRAVGGALDRYSMLDLEELAGTGVGSYAKARWGFFWDYGTVEQTLGLVTWTADGLKAGTHIDASAVREGLGGILDFAGRDRIELESLRERSDLCLCQMRWSADGAALRERLLPSRAEPHASSASAQTTHLLLILLELNAGGGGTLQDELGNFLLFNPIAKDDARLRGLEATPAWQGLLLREISVRAWHRLWGWLVDQIDGDATIDELGQALARELPDVSVGAYLADLPPRTDHAGTEPRMLPAEEQVELDQTRTAVDRQLGKLLLGAMRMDELPSRVAVYFEHAPTERQSRLRPGWLRALIPNWADQSLRDFAIFLTQQMIFRASQVTLSKARFDPTTCIYELPLGISVRDGLVVKDTNQASIDTWFRWNALARILAGVGLTENVDGRWQVTEQGRLS